MDVYRNIYCLPVIFQNSVDPEVNNRGDCFHGALFHGERKVKNETKMQWIRRTVMEIKQSNEECSEPRIDWRSIKASMGKWWLNGRGKDAGTRHREMCGRRSQAQARAGLCGGSAGMSSVRTET